MCVYVLFLEKNQRTWYKLGTESSGKHLMSCDMIEIPGTRFLQLPPFGSFMVENS